MLQRRRHKMNAYVCLQQSDPEMNEGDHVYNDTVKCHRTVVIVYCTRTRILRIDVITVKKKKSAHCNPGHVVYTVQKCDETKILLDLHDDI